MKGSKKQRVESELSVPGVDFAQLERLLAFMSEHGLEEFEYVHGDLRIRLKKGVTPPSAPPAAPAAGSAGTLAPTPSAEALPTGVLAPVQPPGGPAEEQHLIKSPIVGTYYAGPNPEAAPFVRVGDMVEAGQTVCIIEAMKLMNEIEADISGQVAQILVENGQPVEYGEPLFALQPAGKKKQAE
jgi:acetyl-CoA carboxylase biotin carboxyl carrier protein